MTHVLAVPELIVAGTYLGAVPELDIAATHVLAVPELNVAATTVGAVPELIAQTYVGAVPGLIMDVTSWRISVSRPRPLARPGRTADRRARRRSPSRPR